VIDAQAATSGFTVTRLLLGLWCAVSTLEWVSNAEMFGKDGLLSWHVLGLRQGRAFRSSLLRKLVWERSMTWVLALRLAAASLLVASARPALVCASLVIVVVTSWVLTLRCWLGSDGADQMGQTVAIGALLVSAGLLVKSDLTSFAGVVLIAGQLTLAYITAGISKLASAEWRSGQALVGIINTYAYGHPAAARVVARSRWTPWCLCWLVITAETAFPLAIFASRPALVTFLIVLLALHLLNGALMGLNLFTWAFLAAYPSVIAVQTALHL
jgi:hypothetical protein